jgi:hypothetical protein
VTCNVLVSVSDARSIKQLTYRGLVSFTYGTVWELKYCAFNLIICAILWTISVHHSIFVALFCTHQLAQYVRLAFGQFMVIQLSYDDLALSIKFVSEGRQENGLAKFWVLRRN